MSGTSIIAKISMSLRQFLRCCVGSLFCGAVLGVLSSLEIILLRKRELVPLLYFCCGCLYSVTHPRNDVDWSSVCDCDISWSYSLTLFNSYTHLAMMKVLETNVMN